MAAAVSGCEPGGLRNLFCAAGQRAPPAVLQPWARRSARGPASSYARAAAPAGGRSCTDTSSPARSFCPAPSGRSAHLSGLPSMPVALLTLQPKVLSQSSFLRCIEHMM
jgi:hypothetical protein